jgi:hypothetical protein
MVGDGLNEKLKDGVWLGNGVASAHQRPVARSQYPCSTFLTAPDGRAFHCNSMSAGQMQFNPSNKADYSSRDSLANTIHRMSTRTKIRNITRARCSLSSSAMTFVPLVD